MLIACGVLALGLSGLAAMIPAAGMRLSDAMVADRSRFVAASGHADMLNRGLTGVAAFSGATRAVAFGPVATAAAGLSPSLAAAGIAVDQRAFVSEDEVIFDGREESLANRFGVNGLGARDYRNSQVWGATLVPAVTPAQAGGSAVLTIAVFRREPGTAKLVALTRNADGVWQCAEADRIQFLRPCSAVLVVRVDGVDVRPEWLAVRASWSASTVAGGSANGSVVLATEGVASIGSAGSIQVIGFPELVRIQHRSVTLQ